MRVAARARKAGRPSPRKGAYYTSEKAVILICREYKCVAINMHRTPRLHSRDTTFLTSEIPTSGCVKLAQLPNVSGSSAARPHTPLLPTLLRRGAQELHPRNQLTTFMTRT